MGGLCGGAHEISGIKAPIFLPEWVGVVWFVVLGRVVGMGVWGGWCCGGGGGGLGVVGWVVDGEWWLGGGWCDWMIFPMKFKFSKIVTLV